MRQNPPTAIDWHLCSVSAVRSVIVVGD